MLKRFEPVAYVPSAFCVTPEALQKKGIRAIMTDLDNTLIEWNRAHATDEVIDWIRSLQRANIDVLVMSNNNEERVRTFCEPLGLPYIARANKPLKGAFVEGMRRLGVTRDEVVMIGDQLMTDVLGANRAGVPVVLVLPVVQSDAKATKFNRFVESKIMNTLQKRGLRVQEGELWNN